MTAFVLSVHAVRMLQERGIQEDWVAQAIASPQITESDPSDQNLRHALVKIPEFGGRVLRVVYNQDRHPPRVVTAFFDRSMRGKL